jgi:hypothetical protein
MQFSSKEDIEVPISDVFAMLSEFESYERSAIRRGVEVHRVVEAAPKTVGLSWDARFILRGKPRDVRLVLTEYETPIIMKFEADSQGIDGKLMLELLALSPRRTRMSVVLNMAPKTLSARLLVQSLKLAKGNLTKRFKLKVADYAKSMEERHSRMA